jgi:hypothetical protein
VASCCEHRNEPVGSIKEGKWLAKQLLTFEESSGQWSHSKLAFSG